MDETEFLGIAVVGAVLSLGIEWAKERFGTDTLGTKILTLVLAFVVGGIYYFLRSTPLWVPIVGVLTVSSTVYAFFLK